MQYRLRREDGRFRRRYVVTAIDAEGRSDWEWEPISTRQVFKRLTAQASTSQTSGLLFLLQIERPRDPPE